MQNIKIKISDEIDEKKNIFFKLEFINYYKEYITNEILNESINNSDKIELISLNYNYIKCENNEYIYNTKFNTRFKIK